MTREEMNARGWDILDILLITGDAYIDHPSFGTALLGRWLESRGYRVGVVAQPRWDTPEDIAALGRPRLFAGITAGALDSMLAHYTAFRKKRHDDAYTPGGIHGKRPNRASIVYTSLTRHAFPGLPAVIGGIEASLRRVSHYDFWSDKVRRSLLLDSKADLLVYGMAERAVLQIARAIEAGGTLQGLPGTVYATRAGAFERPREAETMGLPSHDDILADPDALMQQTLAMEEHVHRGDVWAVQRCGDRDIILAPPAAPLEQAELDALYDLPFTRQPHPSYQEPIPAVEMIQFSITSHRGCGGGCSFCSLALHQGRRIQSRSAESIKQEARALTRHHDWRGSISDVGGPSANMWGGRCAGDERRCVRRSCLTPEVCANFRVDQAGLAGLLQQIAAEQGVKHLRVASGVRFDLALKDMRYVDALLGGFVGGQLKLAPEHSSEKVLRLMRKPPFRVFEKFLNVFEEVSVSAGREQYVVPYLMSAFPGCTDDDMRALADWLRRKGWRPRQVQCFIPTPGTVATAMYYTGKDTDGNSIFVARSDAERLRQHAILCPPDRDQAIERRPPRKTRPEPRQPMRGRARRGPRR